MTFDAAGAREVMTRSLAARLRRARRGHQSALTGAPGPVRFLSHLVPPPDRRSLVVAPPVAAQEVVAKVESGEIGGTVDNGVARPSASPMPRASAEGAGATPAAVVGRPMRGAWPRLRPDDHPGGFGRGPANMSRRPGFGGLPHPQHLGAGGHDGRSRCR